jgi:hypothetical protein
VEESNRAPIDAVALAGERERVRVAMQQCETLAAEVWALRRRCAGLEARATEFEARATFAEETIANMQRSWFWRARLLYARVFRRP